LTDWPLSFIFTLDPIAANVARKHLLMGFGTTGVCFQQMRTLGFPQAYAHLGEEFETGEVTMDHHDDLARLYNVSTDSCNTFVFVPKCVECLRTTLTGLLCLTIRRSKPDSSPFPSPLYMQGREAGRAPRPAAGGERAAA
jgi:hypothetical protein